MVVSLHQHSRSFPSLFVDFISSTKLRYDLVVRAPYENRLDLFTMYCFKDEENEIYLNHLLCGHDNDDIYCKYLNQENYEKHDYLNCRKTVNWKLPML